MRVSDFDYELPAERIAQTPAEPRDSARLLVLHRSDGTIEHRHFRDLPDYLEEGDLIVANDSRVIPARLLGRKAETSGAIEVLLLRPRDERAWETLVRGRVRSGTHLVFATRRGEALRADVESLLPNGGRLVRFERPIEPHLPDLGQVPLPPYISKPLEDPERYQTVYARVAGSAAAPTAGLHFTPSLIGHLEDRGCGFAFVTLHIGLDTFRPVEVERTEDHTMYSEWCELPATTAAAVNAAQREGRRVVAVGTTSVRVLETGVARASDDDTVAPYSGWTDLFIAPGYNFQAVAALITNFHFPRSTLLMLVAAFAGKESVDQAYAEAMDGDYRFYSFGDAMLIL